jgi:hypothetical protein
MSKNARLYNEVFTLPVNVIGGTTNNISKPYFFTGYPILRGKRIKAISINPNGDTAFTASDAPYYVTLVDGKQNQLLFNYPMTDLFQHDAFGNQANRLRLFDLYDIDLLNSYWTNQNNLSWVSSGAVMFINFYF